MIVYKDCISGDEMFTDSYRVVEEGVFYKVFGKNEIIKSNEDYDIGANPSAEETAEALSENVVSGCDIVLANRLTETHFNKKSYKSYIGAYMKALLEKIPEERKAAFMNEMATTVKEFILKKFDDWQFFLGESMDAEGMAALMANELDPVTNQHKPYMLFFKDGLLEEKQ